MKAKIKTTEKKCKKTGIIPILLLFIFVISLGICGYLIFGEINKEMGIKDMETNIQTFINTPAPVSKQPDTNEPENTENVSNITENNAEGTTDEVHMLFDWDGLTAESPYVVGWIQFPGIERINYPIVQHTDDLQFFLTHDWKGNTQSAGSIFESTYNSSDFTDMNTILYGHRMKNGSMFGSLKYYKEQSFMDEHPCFYIYTPDGRKMTYDIICYSSVKDGSDAYMLYFESPDERMAYYEMMIHNAITKRDIELDRLDTTIMLSTCDNSGDYYDRVVILGKLTEIDLNGQITE